jgi:4-hydroxy-3-methylbut-2-en-1-yl diphosphate reductase
MSTAEGTTCPSSRRWTDGPAAPAAAPEWAVPLLARLRAEGAATDDSGLSLRLARTFGFCQGVEGAVTLALAAAAELAAWAGEGQRPRLFLAGEIIHNPSTNERLARAGVTVLPHREEPDRLRRIRPNDWVIVPAFGNTVTDEAELARIGCRTIDTTCGWVRRTWRTVERFAAEGRTTVIHGKVEHEETRATASRARGPYVIVRNRHEAELLAAAIRREAREDLNTPWPAWFAPAFAGKCSPGFDPERDLQRLGLVNQTTMLSNETQAIAAILGDAVSTRGEVQDQAGRFCTEDTFCPATQKRQDAVRALLAGRDLDALLVVGGFRSSNTAHLAALGNECGRSYHIEDAGCLIDGDRIRHLPASATEPRVSSGWRPAAPCTIAVTAGASTPEAETDRVLVRLLTLYREARP